VETSIRIVRLLSLWCALALGLLACGADTETTKEPAGTPPAAEPPALEPAVAPPPAFQKVVLPEQFPQDVPQYPGGGLSDASGEPGGGMFATYKTTDPLEKVSAFYRDSLESQGWRIESERRGMIFVSKGNRTLTLMMDDGGEGTQINLILLGID
jgi:hypothetical protein